MTNKKTHIDMTPSPEVAAAIKRSEAWRQQHALRISHSPEVAAVIERSAIQRQKHSPKHSEGEK